MTEPATDRDAVSPLTPHEMSKLLRGLDKKVNALVGDPLHPDKPGFPQRLYTLEIDYYGSKEHNIVGTKPRVEQFWRERWMVLGFITVAVCSPWVIKWMATVMK